MWPPFNYCCYDELMEQMQMKQNYLRRLNVRDVDNKINQYARSVFGKIGERKINHNTMSYPPCILINCKMLIPEKRVLDCNKKLPRSKIVSIAQPH